MSTANERPTGMVLVYIGADFKMKKATGLHNQTG
jgi:hypothetical protein